MLLWPVDMPAVTHGTVEALLKGGRAEPNRVVAPSYAGSPGGHPALLPARLLPEARALPDEGRMDHLVAAAGPPLIVAVDDPGVLRDVDEPADLDLL